MKKHNISFETIKKVIPNTYTILASNITENKLYIKRLYICADRNVVSYFVTMSVKDSANRETYVTYLGFDLERAVEMYNEESEIWLEDDGYPIKFRNNLE